jgi:hypothetical protein
MPFNHNALIARIGNEQGAREEFARLVAALADLTTRVRRIREDPGDWGIDSFAGRLNDGDEVAVWQAKFFVNGVGNSQKAQIRDSFKMARETADKRGYGLVRWTLVIPLDLSAEETQWWDTWKAEQEQRYSVAVELWDKHRLDTLLRVPDAAPIEAEFFPPFAEPEVEPRPVKPLPPETTYDEMLFIAQLKAADVPELQAAREEFFNAELLVRDVNDKGVEQEVEALQTVRTETRSLWSQEYNDACTTNDGGDVMPALHGAVMRALRDLHIAQGATRLRLNVVHRFGTMHQVVEDGEAGWVRDFRAIIERHRGG